MKFSQFLLNFLLLFLAIQLVYSDDLPELEESVFNKTLNQQNFSVILFYTSFCSHSNEIISNLSDVYSSYYSSNSDLKFYKVNALKEKNLTRLLNLRGYPSLKVFERNTQSFFDWNYDYTKTEMKYLIDLLFFKTIPHFSNLERLKNNKAKFQLFLIGNILEIKEILEIFKSFSEKSDYLLYNFALVDASPQIFNYFLIPEEEGFNNSFVLLRRRYDNFDKRLKITQEIKPVFAKKFEEFFTNYSHPFYLEHFNHRVKNFLIEKSIISIGIFYRKKTKVYDSFIVGLFKNMTRSYILELKYKEDKYFTPLFNPKRLVFTFLDTEDVMVRRLAFFMGFSEKDVPIIAAFKISKENKRVYTHFLSNKFQESTYFQIINSVESLFHESNNYIGFKSHFKHQTKPKDSKIYDIDPDVLNSFLKLFHPKFQRSIHIVEYSASFCLHSKKLSVIMEKFAKNDQNFFNGFYVYYGRMQLYGSEFSLAGIEKVPVLRLFFNNSKYIEIDLNDFSEKSLIETLKNTIKNEINNSEPIKKTDL